MRITVAKEQRLRRLPDVGATRAKAIPALRERIGRIQRAEALLRVKGIGRRSPTRLRPLVIVDPRAGLPRAQRRGRRALASPLGTL